MKFKLTIPLIYYNPRFLKTIMRTFLFFYCAVVFSFNPNKGFSQNINIIIDVNKTVSIEQIFELIKEQTDYQFVYRYDLVKDAPRIFLESGVIKADTLLKKGLTPIFCTYEFNNNTVIVKRKKTPLGLTSLQNTRIIKGQVTDQNKLPLPGVAVVHKNDVTKGTTTDFDGEYEIAVPRNKKVVLQFSSIGYTTKEIEITNQQRVDVVLFEETNVLEEVVLNTGYQKISRERATGSFQNIKPQALTTKIAQNILSKIEGEFSGIVFDNTDGPTIRGISTIHSNNDPLIVVDGFPLTQDLSSINPSDIKNVTILKDAAAASIWGIRAANGVIVIETKKGKKNQKPQITFSTNLAITPQQDLFDLPYASTESFLEFEKHRADNEWINLPRGRNQPPLGKGIETYLLLNDGQLSQSEAGPIISQLRTVDSRKEFADLFMSDAYWTQTNLAISGGGEHNIYRASVTYNRNENQGFFSGNTTDEIITNLNGSFNITEKLTFSNTVNFNHRKIKRNGLTTNDRDQLLQYQRIIDDQGNLIPQPRTFYQQFKEDRVAEGYPYNWDYNLKQEFDNRDNATNATSLRLQTSLKYDIFDFLSIQGSYQYEWADISSKSLFNEDTYRVRDFVNTFTTTDRDTGELVSAINKGHIITRSTTQNSSHTGRFQLNLDKEFQNNTHRITSIAGYELRQIQSESHSLTRYGFNPQSLAFDNVPFGERVPVTPIGSRVLQDPTIFGGNESRFVSYFGNLAYTYLNRYTLTASTRLDDANLFGASKKYRNIPLYSVGIKWDLAKEDFFNSSNINLLSIRATYGSNGNVNTSTSPFLQASLSNNPTTGLPFAFVSGIKNPELRLEKTYVTNVGLDFGLFNSRINGSIEYYERKSEDLLSQVEVPAALGFNSALLNVGEMENKGIDINLNAEVIRSKNFSYVTTINLSYNDNRVTKVDVPNETVLVYINGREPLVDTPLRYLYSYQYAGLDTEGRPQAYNENREIINFQGEREVGGDIEAADIESTEALVFNGTTTPRYYGSWINTMKYKNFFMRSLITFKLGHVFRNTNILNYSSLASQFVTANIHQDYENRWQNPQDENTTDIPRLPLTRVDAGRVGYRQYYPNGDHLVDSASHIRFREIVLGYRFESDISKKLGLENTSISIQANNLGVIDFNKWGLDPENLLLPVQPTYTLNFTANF
ncbi:SusC/RagA family TonB-linked outer membrane protein [Aquimarina aquimarini]|uniref:SusC/RagA family TonB-linked outer membrane protein n=1 Tax=Aquimarina aquimarini TaxID=1191734 RepID=UPI000D5506B3|nr:SusC/RagA family TonB-linked outer membrane protein [Aquimarina aquimarini]